jgi:hypothetical protein
MSRSEPVRVRKSTRGHVIVHDANGLKRWYRIGSTFLNGRGREVIFLDIDTQITRVKELIARREEIDAELSAILSVTPKVRKPQHCSHCNEEGHTARTGPKQQAA